MLNRSRLSTKLDHSRRRLISYASMIVTHFRPEYFHHHDVASRGFSGTWTRGIIMEAQHKARNQAGEISKGKICEPIWTQQCHLIGHVTQFCLLQPGTTGEELKLHDSQSGKNSVPKTWVPSPCPIEHDGAFPRVLLYNPRFHLEPGAE